MRVPKKVKSNLDSAKSLLEDANVLPPALKYNASRVFLLITSWELLQIAKEEFSDFAKTKKIDPKIHRDHQLKLKDAPKITHNKSEKGELMPTQYVGADLSKVRELALFGEDNISREELFLRRWHYDGFARKLRGSIALFSTAISFVEDLPNK